MGRIAYINGVYQDIHHPAVPVEDRGLQFADGVYEVWSVRAGKLLDDFGHFTRLNRSLSELRIRALMSDAALRIAIMETLRRNRVRDGLVYLQVTRGVARRDHAFPASDVRPTVIITAKPLNIAKLEDVAAKGARVITITENRWGRCDIKTTSLTANVLAKQAAKEANAAEAWFVDAAGYITEGSSTNAWIVDAKGYLRTRPATDNILNGITRRTVIRIAESLQVKVDETPFTVEEAQSAREAFFTAATAMVTPVTYINDVVVGQGAPGPLAQKLRALYLTEA